MLKKIIIIFFFPIILLAQTSPREITLGFVPGGDRENLKKGALALAKQLQQELRMPVNIFIPKTYGKLTDAIQQKRVDFAFLSANTLVTTEQKVPVKILLKKVWNEPFYYSVLVVRKDSGINKIEQLKGKKIAFVDPKSTSGYLYPQVMLKKKKIDQGFFLSPLFSGSHAESVDWLEQKKVDGIFTFSDDKIGDKSAWTKFIKSPANKKNYNILWISEPIPNDPFCVRQDFYDQYPKLSHNVMMAVIDAHEKLHDNKEVLDALGSHGMMPATSRQYDPVREMVKELKLQVSE